MGAQRKGAPEPPFDEAELKTRMLVNIRVGLVFRDLTSGDLGDHMGWSDATRSRRLSSHRGFPPVELVKVARYLRVSVDDLFLPQTQFIALVARGMSREELLRKLAQSACLRVVDAAHGQTNLFDAALPPAELTVILTSAAG